MEVCSQCHSTEFSSEEMSSTFLGTRPLFFGRTAQYSCCGQVKGNAETLRSKKCNDDVSRQTEVPE